MQTSCALQIVASRGKTADTRNGIVTSPTFKVICWPLLEAEVVGQGRPDHNFAVPRAVPLPGCFGATAPISFVRLQAKNHDQCRVGLLAVGRCHDGRRPTHDPRDHGGDIRTAAKGGQILQRHGPVAAELVKSQIEVRAFLTEIAASARMPSEIAMPVT